jgi:hypothetical protein
MFMVHGTDPINWVYTVRQRLNVFIKQQGDKRLDSREIAFLEEELLLSMDRFIALSEQIADERELEEQARLDHEHEELLTAAN